VVDDKTLWSIQRDRVYSEDSEEVIVLLGDCRVQLGLVPEVLREGLPGHRVVQLAIEQSSPMATLRDLAADEAFDGIVLCGANTRLLFPDMWDSQQAYVDHYHERFRLEKRFHRQISTWVQSTFVSVHPELRVDDIVVNLVKEGKLPEPYHIEIEPDRTHRGDYSNVDIEAHRTYAAGQAQWQRTNAPLVSPPKWLQEIGEIEDWVQAIQKRGGEVVFVRMPTTGAIYTGDEFIFPKRRYWDAFAAWTSAPCVHFKDWPQLASFDCPDLSHLDRTDAPAFTVALAQILADQGALPTPSHDIRAWAQAPPSRYPDASASDSPSGGPSADSFSEDEGDWPMPADADSDWPTPATENDDDDWPTPSGGDDWGNDEWPTPADQDNGGDDSWPDLPPSP
jgi:hypothetical protein